MYSERSSSAQPSPPALALLPTQKSFALTPASGGGYNGWNAAEDSGALFSITAGGLTRPLVVMRSTETFPRAQILRQVLLPWPQTIRATRTWPLARGGSKQHR